jgi:Fe(3+) dicitrate transport protein
MLFLLTTPFLSNKILDFENDFDNGFQNLLGEIAMKSKFIYFFTILVTIGMLNDLADGRQQESSAAPGGTLTGLVVDTKGAAIPSATVKIRPKKSNAYQITTTDSTGRFRFDLQVPGEYQLTVMAQGFSVSSKELALSASEIRNVDIVLQSGEFAEDVTVIGTRITGTSETMKTIPGSVEIIDQTKLTTSRVFTVNEALRKASGINVREEEGFGLRPNIGIRGLNPTRSTKVLLLEDGIPLSYAPYGDNASYYHPPIDRFDTIEILKGSGQILYGPVTVGGVINYITPAPPLEQSGFLTLTGGNRDYFNGHVSYGDTWRQTGFLVDFLRKQGDGARDNVSSELNDINLKLVTSINPQHLFTFKGNYYTEDSNVTYSGLRESEYQEDPRQNPFKNDFFYGDRYSLSVNHTYVLNTNFVLSTNVYGSNFQRHWWRQSSNSGQRPNDSPDPNCGGMANLNTTCGIEGRLREYYNWGIEPRLRVHHNLFGVGNQMDFGVRVHFETQDRIQRNGPLPTSRTGVVVEKNERRNQAYSLFWQNRFLLGKWVITPGARVERVQFERTNELANNGMGVTGETDLTQVVPGLGVSYNLNEDTTFFSGIHRGFAPPRTEDIISNTGGVVDLDSELSWNFEAGIRGQVHPAVNLNTTFFRMDYENQIVPASLAGGVGATFTNGGETLHQGIEFGALVEFGTLFQSAHNFYLNTVYTFIPDAKFTGTRFSSVSGFSTISVSGNRLPYAPEHLLNVNFGYSHRGIDLLLEAVHVGDQFGDDLNTVAPTEDGQRGLIPASTIWNAAVNYRVEQLRSTLFVTVKNLLDDTFIVDRARGILPGSPRLVHAGISFNF